MSVTEAVCDTSCRRLERDGTSMRIIKMCAHPAPRLFEDDPGTIRVVLILGTGQTMDDPLGDVSTAAFKTQCVECRKVFGAWDNVLSGTMPSDDCVRQQGVALLKSEGFDVHEDGVICPNCSDPGAPHPNLLRLDLIEGVPMPRRHGWLT